MISPAGGHATARSHPWAVAALLAVNLIPLVGVLLLGWRLSDLMLLYWLENGIIGVFTVLKIVTSRGPDEAPRGEVLVPLRHRLGAVGTAIFFSVHYGIFWTVHGVFVRVFFGPGGGPFAGGLAGLGFPGGPFRGVPMGVEPFGLAVGVEVGGLALAVVALVASHGTSYVVNYLGHGEDRSLSPAALMQQPYARVIVLHVTILGGGFLAMFLGQPLLSLVLLVALKTGVDVRAHLREHGRVA